MPEIKIDSISPCNEDGDEEDEDEDDEEGVRGWCLMAWPFFWLCDLWRNASTD